MFREKGAGFKQRAGLRHMAAPPFLYPGFLAG